MRVVVWSESVGKRRRMKRNCGVLLPRPGARAKWEQGRETDHRQPHGCRRICGDDGKPKDRTGTKRLDSEALRPFHMGTIHKSGESPNHKMWWLRVRRSRDEEVTRVKLQRQGTANGGSRQSPWQSAKSAPKDTFAASANGRPVGEGYGPQPVENQSLSPVDDLGFPHRQPPRSALRRRPRPTAERR